jgi:predicted dehydrogenase
LWNLPAGNWRLSPVEAPVGPLSATGIHLVDLSVALLGRPTEVWARLRVDIPPFANGSALAVGLGFDSGGSALITAVLATPFAMRLCVYGTEGWVEIRDRSHPEAPTGWDVTSRMRGDDDVTTRFFEAYPAVRANLEAWGRACTGEGEYPVDHEQIRNNVKAFEGITEAALHGGLVRLPG